MGGYRAAVSWHISALEVVLRCAPRRMKDSGYFLRRDGRPRVGAELPGDWGTQDEQNMRFVLG